MTPTKASESTGWRLEAADILVQRLDGEVLVGEAAMISREIRIHTAAVPRVPRVGLRLPPAHARGAGGSHGRWEPGVVCHTSEPYGAAVVVLEPELRAQTEPHDARAVELLGEVQREDGAIAIGSMHGTFGVARDVAANIRAADVFRQRLESARLRMRLRRARSGGAP